MYRFKQAISYLKSIGILMMVFHHLFGFEYFVSDSNTWISCFGSSRVESSFAIFCKLCVALYAFITGSSIYNNQEKYKKIQYRFHKIIYLLKVYIPFCVFFILIGELVGEPPPKIDTFLLNLIGIGLKVYPVGSGTINVCHGWYVSFYILAVLILPPILIKFKKNGAVIDFLCTVVINAIFVKLISGVQMLFSASDSMIFAVISDFIKYYPVIISGYIFTKYGLLECMSDCLKKLQMKWRLVLDSILLVALLVIDLKFSNILGVYLGIFYAPVLILILLDIRSMFINKCKKVPYMVRTLINILSKYNMGLWFLHSIYFTPFRKIQWLAYFPKYSVLIFFWVIASDICVLLAVDYTKKCLMNRLCRS